MYNQRLWIFCFLLVGCQDSLPSHAHKETFAGRYIDQPIYQAEVPPHWERVDTKGDLTDSKTPICSYKIGSGILTLHNFPYSSLEQRIPPEAQIRRWENQIPDGIYDVTPFANGGFGGFRLEASNDEKGMIAYSMQLTPLIFRAFSENTPDLKADYTIKFTGSLDSINQSRDEIDAFVQSFEFIVPIEYGTL